MFSASELTLISSVQMERAGKYKYVVLQATSNSVSFYETIGFVRVGAVARYSVHQKDAPPPTEAEALNFNKTSIPCEPNTCLFMPVADSHGTAVS